MIKVIARLEYVIAVLVYESKQKIASILQSSVIQQAGEIAQRSSFRTCDIPEFLTTLGSALSHNQALGPELNRLVSI